MPFLRLKGLLFICNFLLLKKLLNMLLTLWRHLPKLVKRNQHLVNTYIEPWKKKLKEICILVKVSNFKNWINGSFTFHIWMYEARCILMGDRWIQVSQVIWPLVRLPLKWSISRPSLAPEICSSHQKVSWLCTQILCVKCSL